MQKSLVMTQSTIDTQLLTDFHSLDKSQQLDVLNYLKSLLKKDNMSNKGLLKLAGSISSKDLKTMEEEIEEGCEQIDSNEW